MTVLESIPQIMSSLQKMFGFDRKIVITLISRGISIFSTLGTLFFVGLYLSPVLQGYFYTFYSLIALQSFVELGLNTAIIQFASHEMAELRWSNKGMVLGEPLSIRRLQSLMHFSFCWFGVAAIIVLALLIPIGIIFFQNTDQGSVQIHPEYAWGLVVFFAAAALLVNAGFAILEGCNKVAEVAMIRAGQILLSSLAVWGALACGAGLYSLAIGGGIILLVGGCSLYAGYKHFFRSLWSRHTGLPGIRWKDEIWPLQWRIAVSWASGYLIFNLFNPLIFATHGPIAAGQMGMSLQITSALTGVAMVWISTKAPILGQLIAKNDRKALDHMFNKALLQAAFIFIGAVLVVLFTIYWLQSNMPIYGVKVLPLIFMIALSGISFANLIVFAEAAYLRAHKKEPLMVVSIVGGITTAILALILIPLFSTAGAIISYSVGSILISLVWSTLIFIKTQKTSANLNK